MIERYEVKEISEIWNDTQKFKIFLDVELALMQALEVRGVVPQGNAKKIKQQVTINPTRINEIEKSTRHDIIAFCTQITEQLTPELGRYFHYGVTSSDIIDTALSIQIKKSLEIIKLDLNELLKILHKRSLELKDTITMGRSHGMMAEPMSMGQKILGFYAEFYRTHNDLEHCLNEHLRAQFSGAVGNYTILTPEDEVLACEILNLKSESVSTQVIPRDRLTRIIAIGSLIARAIERLAIEIRHLHRTEVNEVYEGFSKGQKGSSTMPHKKNPISCENLTGISRVLNSHLSIALENISLWHERDISHSSAERLYLPDHFGLLSYSLRRLTNTIENLHFNLETIKNRVKDDDRYLSSFYLHYLIKNTKHPREELYALVQEASFNTNGNTNNNKNGNTNAQSFYQSLQLLLQEKGYTLNLPTKSFDEIKTLYLSSVDRIFTRVFNEYPVPSH